MALKQDFNEEERRGLTAEEIRLGETWLIDHRLNTRVPRADCMEMYELYLKGTTLKELASKFPQWKYEQIILAAVLDDWFSERESAMEVVRKAVTEKVTNSMIGQVNLLSSMVDIAGREWLDEMEKYLENPLINPKPSIRIASLKDLATVQEMMGKAISSIAPQKAPVQKEQPAPTSSKPTKVKANSAEAADAKGKTLTVGDLLKMKASDEQN